MRFSWIGSRRLWQIATIGALLSMCPAAIARADDVLADVNGDGRDDKIAIVRGDGSPAIRLNLTGGHTVWLDATRPVLQLAALDIDRDGDIDLIATTDGIELMAWVNLGSGGFMPRIIDPGPTRRLARGSAALRSPGVSHILEFSIGAVEAILPASALSSPLAGRILLSYSGPPGSTPVSAPNGSRAPPLL